MDFSSVWAFYQHHRKKTTPTLLIICALLIGWHLGRITSPYYTAHPIIFEDKDCADRGSPEELSQLKQQGIAQQEEKTTPTPTESSPEPAVAGTKTSGKFVGSINSNLFHDPSCGPSKRIKKENQIWFSSIAEAEARGYSPSKCTQQKLDL